MNAQRMGLCAVALVSLVLATGHCQAAPENFVAIYQGTTSGISAGHQVTKVAVIVLPNKLDALLPEAMEEGKGKTPAKTLPALDNAVKKLQQGDYVKIGVDRTNLGITLMSIERYDPKPGEMSDGGYIFSKTKEKMRGGTTLTTIVLTKFGKEFEFAIPLVKGDKPGEMVQDPEIVKAIGALQEGSSVWAQTTGGTSNPKIVAIEPYTDPQVGKLLKIKETEIDGHRVPQAQVDNEGKEISLLVPGKVVGKMFVPDRAINAELYKLRPGAQIEFRAHDDGGNLWLREIGIAPKELDAPPADDTKKKDKSK